MIHHIYQIVNQVNSKRYVGYTSRSQPIQRRKAHIRAMSYDNMKHRPLYRAFHKYGIDNFRFELLYCSKDAKHTLSVMESYFITEKQSFITEYGYNLTKGGESNFGWVPSDDTRKLWSQQRKGRQLSSEHKKLLSDIQKQQNIDHPERKERARKWALDNNWRPPLPTAESRKKGAITRTGQHIHTESHKQNLRDKFKACNPFLTEDAKTKRSMAWKNTGRGVGTKNGNAVFCDVFNPEGTLVSSGYLREACTRLSFPFNKFSAAARHGKKLQRGKWKGWHIVKTKRPTK